MAQSSASIDLRRIAAPMVNQSDLPFRILVGRYGATAAYTQMLVSDKLLNDRDYLEYHLRDLSAGNQDEFSRPVVAQLCGNDSETIVKAGRKIQNYCDAIGKFTFAIKGKTILTQKCRSQPWLSSTIRTRRAFRRLFTGAERLGLGERNRYVLGTHCRIRFILISCLLVVSAMSHSFTVPTTAKIRLCQPASKTLEFAQGLEASGAAWMTLHARTVSARRRRQGAARLDEVKRLTDNLQIPVISNGNVRVYDDLLENETYTGAHGLMVGETLLGNPW